jgi:mRNA interferase RelE/StbE
MAKIIVHRRAASYLRKLPENEKKKVKKSLKRLGDNPSNDKWVKNMVGNWSGYSRIRIGNLRVIYWFDEFENTIYVDHIGPRGDIYK